MEGISLISTIHVNHHISSTKSSRIHGFCHPNLTELRHYRWRQRCNVIKCSERGTEKKKKNYYQLLGVEVNSSTQEIKEAYRNLQKKHHPDIAGPKGHRHTLLLNEAYKVLMREELRREYDASIGQARVRFGNNKQDVTGFSSWNGPLRPEALFVDENACVGCRECVHHATNTFVMDEALGCARVKVQYGDNEHNIKTSVDSCPVNCIHWVDTEDLTLLEFLIQPKPKQGRGVFGQGWERPANVFAAANSLAKQLKRQANEPHHRNSEDPAGEETPAQAAARAQATMKIKMDRFSMIWKWIEEIFGIRE